ncbi:hypothetical protein DDB_G0290811 [Dictyostelium discoideum AX4]|uniref:Uncharacterized protein n=1 Tax=Dictyostelium discoideum TaxID=44689 RepID=Q54FJ2_DICDI|nr:hypothetical protein DDB_G0290811 [Dictyostelium discoideum AX4]EAL62039.1 hypothetical protein DDB_G0290811 [Dictyostelium discoideum AX4]|eukprot:XP_635548.1 hypothetical protein DDB_G0290811 [Dictyostelium discoideum AX4]
MFIRRNANSACPGVNAFVGKRGILCFREYGSSCIDLAIYRGFDGPVAGHGEWFLSVFGCPENSFNEGGLKTSAHGYGEGQWNFFHANAPPVNVLQNIINQDPSPGLFFRFPNYPSAPSIIRIIVECET